MITHQHTKIVFTAGPACESEEKLKAIILAGGHICRLNMAHTSHEWTKMIIKRIRKVCKELGKEVAILMDIKGPEVRTGDIEGAWDLQENDILHIVTDKALLDQTEVRAVTVNYPDIIKDVKVGNTILVDSGLIHLKIIDIQPQTIICQVLIPGVLKSRRHINLPGVKVNLPALTQKDKLDIQIGVEAGIPFFALSFVREAVDVDTFRHYLRELKATAKIISKIEDQCGLQNMEAIIKASDGIMVARGDLGVECPYEELPRIQTEMVQACIKHSKPVIVATHMLESMIGAPVPTRAEVNDIAKAVFEKADAIMLSGETSIGKYPVECVNVMNKVAKSTEKLPNLSPTPPIKLETDRSKLVRSAMILAQELGNAPIVVFTAQGYLPTVLSSLRPSHCPIFAFTNNTHTYHEMLLLWGVYPFVIDFPANPEERVQNAIGSLLQKNLVELGSPIVVVTYITIDHKRFDTIQIRHVE